MKKNFLKKGFTLIEMIVSIAALLVLFGAISGTFIWGLRIQRQELARQDMLNQISYALELMSRTLRMAVVDSDGSCVGESGKIFELVSENEIKFINGLKSGSCESFNLKSVSGKKIINYSFNYNLDRKDYPLVSDKIEVQDLKFKIENTNSKPKIVIMMKVKVPGIKETIFQTTISARN
jgi:prepilin-type N-terminal cleavage/methylation domain-containing protein